MLLIQKRTEPVELQNAKAAGTDRFEALHGDVKDAMRAALVREQHGLCCYCTRRIAATANQMKVEHYESQSEHDALQLEWRNLLGACNGGMGAPQEEQHCDTHKGDSALRIDPRNSGHLAVLAYSPSGEINHTNFQNDLGHANGARGVLNLNSRLLIRSRAKVLQSLTDYCKLKLGSDWTPARLARIRAQQTQGQEWPEFVGISLWWLDKKIASNTRP